MFVKLLATFIVLFVMTLITFIINYICALVVFHDGTSSYLYVAENHILGQIVALNPDLAYVVYMFVNAAILSLVGVMCVCFGYNQRSKSSICCIFNHMADFLLLYLGVSPMSRSLILNKV